MSSGGFAGAGVSCEKSKRMFASDVGTQVDGTQVDGDCGPHVGAQVNGGCEPGAGKQADGGCEPDVGMQVDGGLLHGGRGHTEGTAAGSRDAAAEPGNSATSEIVGLLAFWPHCCCILSDAAVELE